MDNQRNAWEEPLEDERKASSPKQNATKTPQYGTPEPLVFRKTLDIESRTRRVRFFEHLEL